MKTFNRFLMAPVDAVAAAPAAPATAPAAAPAAFQSTVDSDAATANSLQDGFMTATGDGKAFRRRGRDTPPSDKPMQEAEKPVAKAADAPIEGDPMDEKAKPAEPEAATEKTPEKPQEKGDKEKNFRALATERDTLKTKVETLEKNLQEALAKIEGTKDYPQVKETLAEREKRLESQENELRMTRYESSEEYREKWLKPATSAWSKAVRSLGEFQVEIPGKADEEGVRGQATYRPATEADFARLYDLPEGAAWREAKQMFGDASPAIMEHRRAIKQLDEGSKSAKAEYQTNGQKLEQEKIAKQSLQQQETTQLWEAENARIIEALPHLLKDRPDDKEFNEALATSKSVVDVAYSEARGSLDPRARVKLDAKIRNRAIAYSPMLLELKRLKEQEKVLKAKIKSNEEGDPGVPSSGRAQGAGEPKTEEERFLQYTSK